MDHCCIFDLSTLNSVAMAPSIWALGHPFCFKKSNSVRDYFIWPWHIHALWAFCTSFKIKVYQQGKSLYDKRVNSDVLRHGLSVFKYRFSVIYFIKFQRWCVRRLRIGGLVALFLRQLMIISLSLMTLIVVGCTPGPTSSSEHDPCSFGWFEAVESKVMTGDAQGHGPDIGSRERRSVVEFRLGIRGSSSVPRRDSRDWCNYIDELVFNTAT